ncbi:MAG: hypothetical protein Q8R76_00945 [Candidatus Omnitrophota bacterium]|nr:hypothetical protein [Candidatus Omnitrophota bacterium]
MADAQEKVGPDPVEVGGESGDGGEKGEKKQRTKVSRMTLVEVEKALEKTAKGMGGMQSRHARALLGRKAYLETVQPVKSKRAA